MAWMSTVFRKKKKDIDADVEQETARAVSDVQSEEDTQLKRRHVELYHGLAMMHRWLISCRVRFMKFWFGCLGHVALLKCSTRHRWPIVINVA